MIKQLDVLAVVASGGVLGALGRYGLGVALRSGERGFPWATFTINVSGCLFIGVLIVLVTEVWAAHRLLRPFLGTGLLGGYTTFSTYVVDTRRLLDLGAAGTALTYLFGTLAAALLATFLGVLGTRALTRRRLA
jgi:CrcB protein